MVQGKNRLQLSAPVLLAGAELRTLLQPGPLLAAVERALRDLDRDALALAATVHLPGDGGGFHLKSAFSRRSPRRAVVKLNGNFPDNPERYGRPTIQGILALLDLERGGVLALMDSPVVTALRTAAVSALAAGSMTGHDVYGELPALLAGRLAGRTDPRQRFVFDSTGLAVTDLAAAELAYESSAGDPGVPRFDFGGSPAPTDERSSP